MKSKALTQLAPRWIDAAGAVAFLALGAAFYLLVIEPMLQHHETLARRQDELQRKREELGRVSSLLAQVESMEA